MKTSKRGRDIRFVLNSVGMSIQASRDHVIVMIRWTMIRLATSLLIFAHLFTSSNQSFSRQSFCQTSYKVIRRMSTPTQLNSRSHQLSHAALYSTIFASSITPLNLSPRLIEFALAASTFGLCYSVCTGTIRHSFWFVTDPPDIHIRLSH